MFMQAMPTDQPAEPLSSTFAVADQFLDGIVAALPQLLSGVVFLALAYVTIRVVLRVVRIGPGRVYPAEQELIVDLSVAVVGVFLWFGATLALLSPDSPRSPRVSARLAGSSVSASRSRSRR
jgi:hypothetical protein